MASHNRLLLALTLLLIVLYASSLPADDSAFQISTDQWDTAATSFYADDFGEDEAIDDGAPNRRSLFWNRAIHYYISYGALSANRIPCPPRSGRSYYTHNCYRARGPVHPYTRGCSAITRCRR
ncbi:ralf-like 34 [Perilla frutescens var. hirtella]|nr:ralf-like 34 [Perilla frutescens var. frutescens]KAH6784312.1 ralf-like 34 [Perilla frutescens var. hirtella]